MVISNGVINLCADKAAVFAEAYRVLRPGGVLQFADIANGKPLPEAAVCEIDLWTGCIAGGLPVDDWCAAIAGAGFDDISVGLAVDAFGGSGGERNARAYDVAAHVFLATKPARRQRDELDIADCRAATDQAMSDCMSTRSRPLDRHRERRRRGPRALVLRRRPR